jgi:hypothetical protein
MTLVPLSERTSPLMQRAIAEGRLSVWEYFEPGEYEGSEEVKVEIESRVAALESSYSSERAAELLARHRAYLEGAAPHLLATAEDEAGLLRLLAFAELEYAVEDRRAELAICSLEPPRRCDLVFEALPFLHDGLDRDGLLRLAPKHLPRQWLGAQTAFKHGETAFFPHPYLAPKRELLGTLIDLVEAEELEVSIAIDPLRTQPLADLAPQLLEDYWSGIKTTRENLDSLDAHDVDNATFHAAVGRSAKHEFFNPLLGTWFDWTRRGDDDADLVKRLYIREIKPPLNRYGEPLPAVTNAELHSERDTAAKRFTHTDGKVVRYPTSSYGPTKEDPRADPGPASHSRKLWRVDGLIPDQIWGELVGLHFRGNELIGEHFAESFPAMQEPEPGP